MDNLRCLATDDTMSVAEGGVVVKTLLERFLPGRHGGEGRGRRRGGGALTVLQPCFSAPWIRHEPAATLNSLGACGRRLSATPGRAAVVHTGSARIIWRRPRPTFYPGPEAPRLGGDATR